MTLSLCRTRGKDEENTAGNVTYLVSECVAPPERGTFEALVARGKLLEGGAKLDMSKADLTTAEVKEVIVGLKLDDVVVVLIVDDGAELPVKHLNGKEPVESIDLAGKRLTVYSAIAIGLMMESNTATKTLKYTCAIRAGP
eukprot:2950477-Prymnesium_polylepis.1